MISSEVQRTLVKSPPELWAELSDPDALARHLGELGEIRITRVEPEKTVEWEAADTTGKVLLKSSGWGTKVILTADRELPTPEPPAESAEPSEPSVISEPAVESEPIVEEQPAPEPRPGFFVRLFRRRRNQIQPEALQAVEPEPEIEPEPLVELQQPALEQAPAEQTQDIAAELQAAEEAATEEVTAVLTAALDRLGAAHHRPFSRA